jgi:shikimate kinase
MKPSYQEDEVFSRPAIFNAMIENMNAEAFDDAMRTGVLRIALIGMSNAGKTTASKTLARDKKFRHQEVDAAIERELGLSDIGAMAAWLGYPDSPQFHERQARYLESEEKHTKHYGVGGNVVLDTTGSYVHLSDDAKAHVQNKYLVVHLDVGEEKVEELIERFFKVPKPVIWGEFFKPKEGERVQDTLIRCYPDLLEARLRRFRSQAQVNIPSHEIDVENGDSIISRIRKALV